MAGPDFAHTDGAVRNRETKARRLAMHLELQGVDRTTAAVSVADHVIPLYAPPAAAKLRRAAERAAGIPRCSDETWRLAFGILREHPLRRVGDVTVPGCTCQSADGLPGTILYEQLPRDLTPGGWPCPHNPADPSTWPDRVAAAEVLTANVTPAGGSRPQMSLPSADTGAAPPAGDPDAGWWDV